MFTTRAFVYVKDAATRDALVEWCEARGYDAGLTFRANRSIVAVNFPTGHVDVLVNAPQFVGGGINCGRNIHLFKALAGMDDATALNHWYIATGGEKPYYAFAASPAALEWITLAGTFRRATAAEIQAYCTFMSQLRKNTQSGVLPPATEIINVK